MSTTSRELGSSVPPLKSFTITLPSWWPGDLTGFREGPSASPLVNRAPDLVIEAGLGKPYVEHAGGCGVPGDAIYVPANALTGNMTEVALGLAHTWIDFRFGVFGFGSNVDGELQVDRQHVELSKQQILCDGKSFDDVIEKKMELGRKTRRTESSESIAPTFTVIRRPRVQYVLGIETTASMLAGEHWKWVNKAAQKLIRYDLPEGTPVAVLSFAEDARVEHPLLPLREEAREAVADSIPGKYQLSSDNRQCMACLFRQLVKLEGIAAGGIHLILMTRGGADSLSVSDEQVIAKYVEEYGIKISTIMIPTVNHLSFYDDASQSSGGASFLIRQSPYPMDTYVNILAALSSILQSDGRRGDTGEVVAHRHEVFTGSTPTTGTIVLPQTTIASHTDFGIYVEDPEEHLIKSVSFEDERGTVFGPFTKMSTSYDLINLKMPNIAGDPPLSKPGQWSYRIEWFPYSGDPIKSTVMVTSTTTGKEAKLEARTWVEKAPWAEESSPYLNVFTRLRMSGQPVLNASLSLSVEVETENGTFLGMSPGALEDLGLGDVDATAGDGIYSLALTDYPARGRYRFTVLARNGGRAYTQTEASLRQFEVTVRGPVVHLNQLPGGDLVPPARIADLRVSLLGEQPGQLSGPRGTLAAFWTSPGGDLRQGTVARHVLVYASSLDQLLGPRSQPHVLLRIDKQTAAGEEMQQLVETPLYDQTCYLAIYAVDQAGNSGRISNIEAVTVASPPPPTSPTPDPLLALLQPPSAPDWMMIGVMSACLGALFLTCVSVLLCFLHTSNRLRRPASPSPSSSVSREDQTDSSSCDSSGRGGSHTREERKELEQQVTELHQIMADQHRIVPVYWSASQLLSKLEQQKSPTTSARHSHHHHVHQSSPPGYESPPPASWHPEPSLARPLGDTDREESEELESEPNMFSRNSLYRSTCRGVGESSSYHDNHHEVAGIPGDIPEKYFVTVSGFPPEHNDSFSNLSRDFVGNAPQAGGGGKPRNITEV